MAGALPMAGRSGGALETFPPEEPMQGAVKAPLSETPQGGNDGYNGVVDVNGQKISVKRGLAEFNGQEYFVSDDGDFVIDQNFMVGGRVVNGVFIEIDDQYLAELQAKGMLEE